MQNNNEQIVELFEVEELENRLENGWSICIGSKCWNLEATAEVIE
jgi:hypothetical protein